MSYKTRLSRGVPRVIDEALSLYKLVIASKVGGIYQEFKENSPIIMFDGGSHSSLFQSIEQASKTLLI